MLIISIVIIDLLDFDRKYKKRYVAGGKMSVAAHTCLNFVAD